jgi:hypothetical protein
MQTEYKKKSIKTIVNVDNRCNVLICDTFLYKYKIKNNNH